ncbi:MAG: FecR family protein [Nitritalea sp.]
MPKNISQVLWRFLCGQASEQDTDTLFKWYTSLDVRSSEGADVVKIDSDRALQAVQRRLAIRPEPLWGQYRSALLVACCLILLGLTIWLLPMMSDSENVATLPSTYHEVKAAKGERRKVMLSDGTEVLLRGGATLRFPQVLAADRTVYLDGEAFFQVKRNDEYPPFQVIVDGAIVRVLGTSFAISLKENVSKGHVTVLSGSVEVQGESGYSERLASNQRLSLNRLAGLGEVQEVDAALVLPWTQERLVFRETALHEVIRSLGDFFELEAIIWNGGGESCLVTGEFDQLVLQQILTLLAHTTGLEFTLTKQILEIHAEKISCGTTAIVPQPEN